MDIEKVERYALIVSPEERQFIYEALNTAVKTWEKFDDRWKMSYVKGWKKLIEKMRTDDT